MTLWKDDDKYKNNYWKKNYYFTGDYATIDDEFYFWLLGRSDDVIKISGHRLGTIELESTFISHESVAEAAITSKPDKIKAESFLQPFSSSQISRRHSDIRDLKPAMLVYPRFEISH